MDSTYSKRHTRRNAQRARAFFRVNGNSPGERSAAVHASARISIDNINYAGDDRGGGGDDRYAASICHKMRASASAHSVLNVEHVGVFCLLVSLSLSSRGSIPRIRV